MTRPAYRMDIAKLSRMRERISFHGSPHLNPRSSIPMCRTHGLKVWEAGFWKLLNSDHGATMIMGLLLRSCSARVSQERERLLLGIISNILRYQVNILSPLTVKISSLAIDNLSDISDPARANIGVSYIYGDHLNQKHQDPTGIMGGLLKQLVAGLPDIPEEVTQAFREAKGRLEGQDSLLPTILNLFPSVIGSFGQVFMFIDALDEFSADTRFKLFRSLLQVTQDSPKTRLFLTGRSHIRPELDEYLAKPTVSVTTQPTPDDIEMFSRWKLDQDLVLDHMDDDLRLEVTAQIHKLPKM